MGGHPARPSRLVPPNCSGPNYEMSLARVFELRLAPWAPTKAKFADGRPSASEAELRLAVDAFLLKLSSARSALEPPQKDRHRDGHGDGRESYPVGGIRQARLCRRLCPECARKRHSWLCG